MSDEYNFVPVSISGDTGIVENWELEDEIEKQPRVEDWD